MLHALEDAAAYVDVGQQRQGEEERSEGGRERKERWGGGDRGGLAKAGCGGACVWGGCL